MIVSSASHPEVIKALSNGNLVVAKTDTIYGILASARSQQAIDRLHAAKNRSPKKACIVLVADSSQIPHLSTKYLEKYLELNRQRPTTIVLPAGDEYLPDVPRQNGKLAFRLVEEAGWQELISQAGPLLAPSANPEGLAPAKNIEQAIEYFGDLVSVYVNNGEVAEQKPSQIIELNNNQLTIIRP